jgi:hypothetical protein
MIRRSERRPLTTDTIRRHLLQAVALGAASSAVGCGGNVVFVGDDDGGSGGGGVTSSSSVVGVTNGSTGTGFQCGALPLEGAELSYLCLPTLTAPCPEAASDEVFSAVSNEVSTWTCADTCCYYWVDSVPCGPDPGGEGCCYVAQVFQGQGCEGRPLRVDGELRLATLASRDDWSARVELEARALSPVARAALAAAWIHSARAEHASVASFARFALELMALGAPADLVRGAQLAMGDEIAHAELCFGVARALTGDDVGPGPLSLDGLQMGAIDPVAVAVATVVEGCVNETLAAALALAELEAAEDADVVRALTKIAEDETRHAGLAWRTVAWMIRRFGEPVREAVIEALRVARPFSIDDRVLAGVPVGVAHAHGRLPADEAREVLLTALEDIVGPCALALGACDDGPPMTLREPRLSYC